MRPADVTRRTIRLYALLGSLLAALGVGVALGADPYPDPPPAPASALAWPTAPGDAGRQGDAQRAIGGIDLGDRAGSARYDDWSGQS